MSGQSDIPNYILTSKERNDEIEDVTKENIEEEKIDCLGSDVIKSLSSKPESFNTSSEESFTLIDKDGEFRSEFLEQKSQDMEALLSSDPVDLHKLQKFALSKGGFIKDDFRKKAWPLLMHMEYNTNEKKLALEEVKKHKDYNQVVLDVNRTLKRFPPGIEEQHRYLLMDQLTALIVRVLDRHPELHYYQGYHDVAITFLLVMGEDKGFDLIERLSITHLHEFMKPTMDRTVYYLTYLYPILKRVKPSLYNHLVKSEVGTVFCLPWLITWYAHTLPDYRDVVRLYDFLLASPYLMPMYIAAAIVLHGEKEIMETECDMAMQHFTLSQIPKRLPLEDILKHAKELCLSFHSDDLQEEVHEIIQRKAEEEKQMSLSLAKRRSEYSKRRPERVARNAFNYLNWPSGRTTFNFLAVAVATTAFTVWYCYYTDRPYLISYPPWGWS